MVEEEILTPGFSNLRFYLTLSFLHIKKDVRSVILNSEFLNVYVALINKLVVGRISDKL